MRHQPDGTRFAWWDDGSGDVTGAASQTPPYPVMLSVVPDRAIPGLIELFEPQAVFGATALAAQVAAVAARGRTVTLRSAERLHQLTTLEHPDVAGAARAATLDDLDVLVPWWHRFVTESGVVGSDAEVEVRKRLTWNGFVLWEDGGRVAMAGRTRTAFGMVRIGPVYTPVEHRRNGYGGAATAAMCQLALDQGVSDLVLITDLTNPTSNALYRRLGFTPLQDRAFFEISSS